METENKYNVDNPEIISGNIQLMILQIFSFTINNALILYWFKKKFNFVICL